MGAAGDREQLLDLSERLSRELAQIHEESYGRPPNAVETHIVRDAVIAEIDVDLLPHERTILEKGVGHDGIRTVRSDYQEAIRATFVAAVERTTGRRVVGFISGTHIEPTFSVEYFKLDPEEGTTPPSDLPR
jgi:uncharacterized protein YbcI